MKLKFKDIQTLVFINFKKKKSNIFYTCIPEEDSAYHTGSAFT